MKKSVVLLSTVSALSLAYGAMAETDAPSIGSVLSTMNAGGGSETFQWQAAATHSELFGLGVRTTVGGYVNEDFALGVIIDYAEYREEYLANAAFRLSESMRVIGSVGLLKESEEFKLGDGREDVSQLEYGLSLKGNYYAGFIRGFEVNAYHTNGKSDTDAVETGDLTGIQVVTQLKPSSLTHIQFGAGYERVEWDEGDVEEGFTLQTLGSLQLSNTLSMNFHGKTAETENTYGLGLTYDMSTAEIPSSSLAISFNEIEGKLGVSDDTRIALNWTVGLGAGAAGVSDVTASSMGSMARADLLADVMTRPAFLPERVVAKAKVNDDGNGTCAGIQPVALTYWGGVGTNGTNINFISTFSSNTNLGLAPLIAGFPTGYVSGSQLFDVVEVRVREPAEVDYGPVQTLSANITPIENYNGIYDGFFFEFTTFVPSVATQNLDLEITVKNSDGCRIIEADLTNLNGNTGSVP